MNNSASVSSVVDPLEGYAWPAELREALAIESENVEFEREKLFDLSSRCDGQYFTLTFLSREYLPLGPLWAECAAKAGVKHFAIGTMDEETAYEMERRHLPHFWVKLSPSLAFSEGFVNRAGFNGKALGIIYCRHKIVMELLARGIHVLCCDIDALIVRYPFDELSRADLAFQRIVHLPKRTAFKWGFSLCGGFVACRACPSLILLIKTVINFQKEVSSDQLAWNLALEMQDVSWDRAAKKYTDKESLIREFVLSANDIISGQIKKLGLHVEALPATRFWRHKFVPLDSARCMVLHPNSPKTLDGKLDVFKTILGCPDSYGATEVARTIERMVHSGENK